MPIVLETEQVSELINTINNAINEIINEERGRVTEDQEYIIEAIRIKITEEKNIEKMLEIYMHTNDLSLNEGNNQEVLQDNNFAELKEALEKTLNTLKFKKLISETSLALKIVDTANSLTSLMLVILLAVTIFAVLAVLATVASSEIMHPIVIADITTIAVFTLTMMTSAVLDHHNPCNARDKVNELFKEAVRNVQEEKINKDNNNLEIKYENSSTQSKISINQLKNHKNHFIFQVFKNENDSSFNENNYSSEKNMFKLT